MTHAPVDPPGGGSDTPAKTPTVPHIGTVGGTTVADPGSVVTDPPLPAVPTIEGLIDGCRRSAGVDPGTIDAAWWQPILGETEEFAAQTVMTAPHCDCPILAYRGEPALLLHMAPCELRAGGTAQAFGVVLMADYPRLEDDPMTAIALGAALRGTEVRNLADMLWLEAEDRAWATAAAQRTERVRYIEESSRVEVEALFAAVRTRMTPEEYGALLEETAQYIGDTGSVLHRLTAALAGVADRPGGVARKLQAQQAAAAAAGQTEEAADLAQLAAQMLEGDRREAAKLQTPPPAPLTAAPPIGTVGAQPPTPEATRLTEAGYTMGGPFIHDLPPGISAVWGSGDDVFWAEGESCILAGPQGVGKSTMAGLLVRGMITGEPVLGFPVKCHDRVLYLAMDRPRQIARALRRQLGAIDRETLDERLVVWEGPPAEDLAKDTNRLLAMTMLANAQVVVVDSLKDAAIGLSDDTVGAGWNRARQKVLAAGGEVLELHHQRKSNGDAGAKIERLYGSIWITSGSGSVLLLEGEPGDPLIKMTHLKPPANEVGPFTLLHDGPSGAMTIHEEVDVVELATVAFRKFGTGTVVNAVAQAIFETTLPSANEIEKARRRLEAAVKAKRLRRNGSTTSGATFYAPVTPTN
jgi:AAA domain